MKYQDIIAKLSLEQKCALLSGGTVFTTRALPGKGIPAITLSDGPNGVRKQAGAADHLGLNPSVPATCFPTSATVANSWDPALGEAVGAAMGEEAAAQGVSVLLGPGLNIKRSPLCGRNFEYFSEDPYLAGKMAAAYVRGIQKNGIAACPKHFAASATCTSPAVYSSSSQRPPRWTAVPASPPITLYARARSAWQAHGSAAPTATSTEPRLSHKGWPSAATPALSRSAHGLGKNDSAIIFPPLACGRLLASTCPARSSAANIIQPTGWVR